MSQLPDTYNISEVQCFDRNDTRLFVDKGEYDQLRTTNEALVARVKKLQIALKEILKWNRDLDRPVLDAYVRRILAATEEVIEMIAKTGDTPVRSCKDYLAEIAREALK